MTKDGTIEARLAVLEALTSALVRRLVARDAIDSGDVDGALGAVIERVDPDPALLAVARQWRADLLSGDGASVGEIVEELSRAADEKASE